MNTEQLTAFMSWFKWVLMGLMIALAIGLLVISIFRFKKRNVNLVKFITVTGIFGALATILYVLVPDFGLGFTPPWLKVHLDEIAIFLVGYMYGPLSAVVVTLIKTLIKLPMTSTAGVGEIGDFFFTIVFVLPAVILYEKRRKLSSVFIGLGSSTLLQCIFAMIMNVYVLIPFYSALYHLPLETLEGMCSSIMPAIKGDNWVWLYALFMVLPMNLIKDAIVIVAVLLLYKRLHILIERIGNNEYKKEVVEPQKEE